MANRGGRGAKPQERAAAGQGVASSSDLLTAVGVILILLAGIVYNHLQVAKGARGPSKVLASASMLGRYASHRGSVVGEVVAITTDRLVIRQSGLHKAVPLSQARLRDGEVILEGDIDWSAAEDAGKAWAGAAANEAETASPGA